MLLNNSNFKQSKKVSTVSTITISAIRITSKYSSRLDHLPSLSENKTKQQTYFLKGVDLQKKITIIKKKAR